LVLRIVSGCVALPFFVSDRKEQMDWCFRPAPYRAWIDNDRHTSVGNDDIESTGLLPDDLGRSLYTLLVVAIQLQDTDIPKLFGSCIELGRGCRIAGGCIHFDTVTGSDGLDYTESDTSVGAGDWPVSVEPTLII
jgi:hypothetical protein